MVEKHEREIFPLTQKRYLFSEVMNFNFFGFSDEQGMVNENVFAYTNRFHSEKALVFYNNTYGMTRGHIKTAVPKLQKTGEEKQLVTVTLNEALRLRNESQYFYIAAEHVSGMEYLFSGTDIHHHGLYREMMGFEYRVFLGFREITDEDGSVATLHEALAGTGTKSVQEALAMQKLQKVHQTFLKIFDSEAFNAFVDEAMQPANQHHEKTINSLCGMFSDFAGEAFSYLRAGDLPAESERHFSDKLESVKHAAGYALNTDKMLSHMLNKEHIASVNELIMLSRANGYRTNSILMLTAYALESLAGMMPGNTFDGIGLYERLMLFKPLYSKLLQQGKSTEDVNFDLLMMRILLKFGIELYDFSEQNLLNKTTDSAAATDPLAIDPPATDPPATDPPASKRETSANLANTPKPVRAGKADLALRMLADEQIKSYIGVNEYEGVVYYSKERFEDLNKWLFSMSYFAYFKGWQTLIDGNADYAPMIDRAIGESVAFYLAGIRMSANAGYKLQGLIESLQEAAG